MNALALQALTQALVLVNAGLNLMDIVADVRQRMADDPTFDVSAYLEAEAEKALDDSPFAE